MSLRTTLFLVPLIAVGCGIDPEPSDESSVDQDLTASEIDSSWYSDAAFTNQVGESDLFCSAGKYQHGQIGSKYVIRFTWPCTGVGHRVACYQYNQPWSSGGAGSYTVVSCPAWLF